MENTTIVIAQTLVATPELIMEELTKIGANFYPMDVLKAYLERYEEWDDPVVVTPQMVKQEILASPYSYCHHTKKYLFEGEYYPTIDDITDHVIDHNYCLITDEKSQIVYYIAY